MKSLIDVFAANVRFYRNTKGFSQEELADIAGIHRTNISAIERGKRNATIGLIEKLANALEINGYLLLKDLER